MPKQYTLTMLPGMQGWKPEIVAADVVSPPGPGEIKIAYGATVQPHRQLEIINGWAWLWSGVRDRGLLNEQFVGAVLFTGAPIDSLTAENRKTSSTIGDFDPDEVFLGIGIGIASDTNGATQMLDSGFRMLREFAKENP